MCNKLNTNICKYLGLYIDKNLEFREHNDYVVKHSIFYVEYSIVFVISIQKVVYSLFYNSFAKSIIVYGILLHGSAAKTNLAKIEKAERPILRAIFFMHRTDSLGEILTKECVITCLSCFLWN